MDLCEKVERRPGARIPMRWCEQTGIDWKGAREKAEATEEAAEPALTGTDSESEADTPDGTAIGTGEEASLGVSSSSGAGRRNNYIGWGPKASTKLSYF